MRSILKAIVATCFTLFGFVIIIGFSSDLPSTLATSMLSTIGGFVAEIVVESAYPLN